MNLVDNAVHHPSDAWLLDYATGTAGPLFDTLIRAHIGTCAGCRATIAFAERLGGELLSSDRGQAGTLTARDICAAYEQGKFTPASSPSRAEDIALSGNIENFVAAYLKSSIEALPWRRLGGGLALCRLDEQDDVRLWMLRGQPGTLLPRHTHAGSELTLVLKGAYFCGSNIYRAGDIEDADETTEHQPIITHEGECICLAVTQGRLQFKSWLPRLLQPFIGI